MEHVIKYRNDIDGLRALAVLVVIFFHYGVNSFGAGFIGVDIFFVISGFLISSIILKELNASTFSYTNFYERRARRILPALFFVTLFSIVFGYIFFDTEAYKDLGQAAVGTSVFASNLYFYLKANDYFAVPDNALLHTWSLAVEEQFYIFFPGFLAALYRFQKKHINYYLAGALVLSFSACVFFVNQDQLFSFYSPVTRVWELLAGVLLASNFYPGIKSRLANQLLSVLGLALISVSLFILSGRVLYPGYNALPPVAGACLLIYTGKHEYTIASKLLSLNVVVFIGKISYSLYLWHWVLLIAFKAIKVGPLHAQDTVILLGLTILISCLSWRFIEQPFRARRVLQGRKKMFIGAGVVSILILGLGLYIVKTMGQHTRLIKNQLLTDLEKQEPGWARLGVFEDATKAFKPGQKLLQIGAAATSPRYLLWGDSHARALINGFDVAAKQQLVSIYVATASGIPPLLNVECLNYEPKSRVLNDNILQFLATQPQIKVVFFAARWNYYGDDQQPVTLQNETTKKTHLRNNKMVFEKGLTETVQAIIALNKKVVLITDVPTMDAPPNTYINQQLLFNRGKALNTFAPNRDAYFKLNKNVNTLFSSLKKNSMVTILPVHEKFMVNGQCLIENGGHLLYKDAHHLSYYGSLKMVDELAAALK